MKPGDQPTNLDCRCDCHNCTHCNTCLHRYRHLNYQPHCRSNDDDDDDNDDYDYDDDDYDDDDDDDDDDDVRLG